MFSVFFSYFKLEEMNMPQTIEMISYSQVGIHPKKSINKHITITFPDLMY